jgi:hypothetical protein
LARPAAVLSAALALAGPASADDTVNPQAQALFLAGRAAMEKGDMPTACAKFTESLALSVRPSTVLNLAQCEQNQGRFVSSLKHWRQGIEMLPPGDERLAVAKERAAALGTRVPHLTVKLTGPLPEGARVEVDGVIVPAADLAAGVPQDPGRHVVVLLVPGAPDTRSTVDLAEREAKPVTLPVPMVAPKPKEEESSATRKAGFALIGVGAAGAVIAAVTGGVLISKNSQIQQDCPMKVCNSAGRALINSTGSVEIANGIGWGVGLAGVAAGVILVVVGKSPDTQTGITPATLPGGGGLWVTRRF